MRPSLDTNYRGGEETVRQREKCRKLRMELTDAERALWYRLQGRRFAGIKFRRQHQFGPFILDFYSAENRLAVEVDGGQHNLDNEIIRDADRTRYLEMRGVRVLRFSNLEVLREIDAVMQSIGRAVGLS